MRRVFQTIFIISCLLESIFTTQGFGVVVIDSLLLFMSLVWIPFFTVEQRPGGNNNDQGV
jgi:hypothetical protein